VEYGLLVALIGGMLCLGIGATVKEVFGQSIQCFISTLQSEGTPASCPLADTTPGGTGGGGGGGGGGGPGGSGASPSPSPSPSTSVTPTPTPSA
jgi:hypothetical protein